MQVPPLWMTIFGRPMRGDLLRCHDLRALELKEAPPPGAVFTSGIKEQEVEAQYMPQNMNMDKLPSSGIKEQEVA